MNRIGLLVLLCFLTAQVVFSQAETNNPEEGSMTAQQKLKEISVSKLEDASFWYGKILLDNGLMEIQNFQGGAHSKIPIKDEQEYDLAEPDVNVLGVKVSFFRRGAVTFNITPIRPIPIEGITKTVSVWVAGRNTEHVLQLVIADAFGKKATLPMGKLNFTGWKKLTVTIPPDIRQVDFHFSDRNGITLEGFNVKCNMDETYGRFYVYLDDVRAVTDLFIEESRDSDDMLDAW